MSTGTGQAGRPATVLSSPLASGRRNCRRGAPLHTPGPAPPSAGFSSLKAPGRSGRRPVPARPPTARPLGPGAPLQVGAAVEARREPYNVRAGRALGARRGWLPLRADGETEAWRGQGLSRETLARELSAPGLH